jgi:hypothetical protein
MLIEISAFNTTVIYATVPSSAYFLHETGATPGVPRFEKQNRKYERQNIKRKGCVGA